MEQSCQKIVKTSISHALLVVRYVIASILFKRSSVSKDFEFVSQMMLSTNNVVRLIAHQASENARSPIGSNMSYLKYKYNINFNDDVAVNIKRVYNNHVLSQEKLCLIDNVNNLIKVRSGSQIIDGFDIDMVEYMITAIATM